MHRFRTIALLPAVAIVASAQLTVEQKVNDLEHLASLYAKQYAPYEWKRDFGGFDLFDLGPWLARARATTSDLDFYDLMSEYVSRLNDAHAGYSVPSNFVARLNFSVDIYDGIVLIDSINRTRLPAAEFPFQIGDELVSVDGKSAADWIVALERHAMVANPRSTRRFAANLITIRPQQLIAHAVDLPPYATVVTRNAHGALSTHSVPWAKSGLPLTRVGPVPYPSARRRASPDTVPDYMKLLLELQRCEISRPEAVLGVGSLFPIFGPPPNYQPRLPRTAQDNFTSGVIQHAGLRIGFIRIPVFAPADPFAAIEQFRSEILYFQDNTDGLIVDEMRNPGGIVGYVNALLQMLFPYEFRTIGFEIRATSNWVQQIGIALENARAQGAPPHIIALFEQIRDDIVTANSENRGRTGPLPLDTGTLDRQPATDAMGRTTVYTKPLMVVIDEASASAADMFPATIQDNNRGILFGMRTMGAGGSVVSLNAGNYTEGFTSLTQTLMSRKAPVSVPGYPTVPYIENVGVHPDIVQDYMTRENLMQNGQPFVTAVLDAMAEHIRRSR